MTLLEFRTQVDSLINHGHGEDTVLITLSQPSVGARSFIDITGIFAGFDFERGQVRIEPTEPICKRGRAKNDPVKINIFAFSGPRKFYNCPMCDSAVRKDSKYCSTCGQRLVFDPTKEPSDSQKQKGRQTSNEY